LTGSNFGKVVLNTYFHDEFVQAMEMTRNEKFPIKYAEERIFGFNHSGVGVLLLRRWCLPPSMVKVVEFHHKPDEKLSAVRIAFIVHVANYLCRRIGIGNNRADFIFTGSINQCSVEAGTSDLVKDLPYKMNVQDSTYIPAGDMFEMGSKVQALKRGVFFPARVNKLYELYRHYSSLDEIDERTRQQLEKEYFKCSFESIWGRVHPVLSGRTDPAATEKF
jgi:hypothetical protein